MEIIKNVATIIGLILSILTLAGIITKFQKKITQKLFDKYNEELKSTNKKQNEDIAELKVLVQESIQKNIEQHETFNMKLNHVQNFCAEDCRNVIKTIYYRYCDEKKIPLYERKMADAMYKIYDEEFHENSYGHLLYLEICKWDIDPTKGEVFNE